MSNDSLKAALVQRGENRKTLTTRDGYDIRLLLEKQRPEIESALVGTALNSEKFARVALTIINQDKNLQSCTARSLLGALMTAAQLGLELGPLGEAYLIPRGQECTFQIGYRGMLKLAWNSGQIRHIDADVVLKDEEFDFQKGTEPFLRHKPGSSERHTKDGVTHVYAVATTVNGGSSFVVMNVKEVERVRRVYAKGLDKESSPWNTEWAQMAKKTALRQLVKLLPVSTGMNTALALDGKVRRSFDTSAEEAAAMTDVEDDVIDVEPEESTNPTRA